MQLLTTKQFNGISLDCYRDESYSSEADNDFWATREQIGRLLEYSNPGISIGNIHNRNKESLDKFSRINQIDLPSGGTQMTTVYSFKGLLEICRFSNQPNADRVMDFLQEIADEIRRNGIYITPAKVQELMKDPDIWIHIFQTLKDEQMKVRELQAQVEQDKPKVIFAESVETSKGSILIRELAKLLRQNGYITGEKRLFIELRERGFLIKRGTDYNMPTQKSMELGLMEVLTRTINRGEGEIQICKTPKINMEYSIPKQKD